MNNKIIVMGSCTIDHTTFTEVMPSPGVTGKAVSFLRNIGGKGANQACAAHYLGANVFFFGSIGNDEEGTYFSSKIKEIGLRNCLKKSQLQTGVASITINMNNGENQILIVQGANLDISKSDILSLEDEFKGAKIFLTQLETNYDSIRAALELAKKYNLITILNPAPFMELDDEILRNIDYFIPNEHELDQFIPGELSYEEKAKQLISKGIKNVIVTLGDKGSMLVNNDKIYRINSVKVNAVDTTAAGDSYIGAFMTALSQNKTVEEAMEFANKCSAITVTRKGAISSLPKLEEIR